MRLCILLALALGSTVQLARAQNSSVMRQVVPAADCPLQFLDASLQPVKTGFKLVPAVPGSDSQGTLRIHLENSGEKEVRSFSVMATVISGQALPAASSLDSGQTLPFSIQRSIRAGADATVQWPVHEPASMVNFIRLQSVTFSDGSRWSSDTKSSCSFVPHGRMQTLGT